jgi:DNA-binding NarL/FixJ family response regulator
MKTIFLAEGEKHVREALRLLFEHQYDFAIMGEAGSAESTLANVCKHPPDVLLLDWHLPGLYPQRMIAALRECSPKMLIFATSVQPEQEKTSRQFGVDGFLLKQLPPDQYLAYLNAVMERSNQEKTA